VSDATIMRARAAQLAEQVLYPSAAAVDGADRIPAGHLDRLAAEGLYGVAAPPEDGGIGLGDFASVAAIIESLASGCLATAFVWLQHLGPLLYAAHSDQPGVRARWLGPLTRGEVRAGIAFAGLAPGAALRVAAAPDGFRISGRVPWVTGWDLVDVVGVGVRDEAGTIHHLLVDAREGPTLRAERQHLVAVHASRTVALTFDDHRVDADRLVATEPYPPWAESNASGGTLNGFLSLGLVRRVCALLGPGPLDAELDACRDRLLTTDAAGTPAARGAAAELAYRAAGAFAVHTGSAAVLAGDTAQRLVREATFLLVFGSRPAIRDDLYGRLVRQ
jgi:alkylation response protein AidB-like acyl-CoA dehydrogenase